MIPFLSLLLSEVVLKVINDFEYAVKEYSFFGACPTGVINMGFDWIKSSLKQFKLFKNPEAFGSVGVYFYREHIPQRVGLAGFLGINGYVVYYSGRNESLAYSGIGWRSRDVPALRGDNTS